MVIVKNPLKKDNIKGTNFEVCGMAHNVQPIRMVVRMVCGWNFIGF